MVKFAFSRTDGPWFYPGLGFKAAAGAILDGTLHTPAITDLSQLDTYWTVYGGGSAETGITPIDPPNGTSSPSPTPAESSIGLYRRSLGTQAWVTPTQFVNDPDVSAALAVAYAAQLTTVPKSVDYTVGAQEFVEADSTAAVRTMTGPAAGAAHRWGVKKVNGTSLTPGNKVTISYLNSAGAVTLLDLTVAAESKIFRPSGAGYRVETGDTPKTALDYAYVPINPKALVANLPHPFYLNHRCGGLMAPEETDAASRASVAAGVDGLDFDVWLTGDYVFVTSHDGTADRCSNGTGTWATMSATQVSKLLVDAATLLPGSPTGWGAEAPLFHETTLRNYGNKIVISIEVQDGAVGYPYWKALIERLGIPKNTILLSIKPFATATQAVADGFICQLVTSATAWDYAATAAAGYTFVAQDQSTITPTDVAGAHAHGIKLVAYSPNSHARRDALLTMGVDGFYTDDGGYLKETFNWRGTDLFTAQDITFGLHPLQGVAPQFFAPDMMGWAAGGAGSTTKVARVGYVRSPGPNGVITFKAAIDADGGAATTNGMYFYVPDVDDYSGSDAQVLQNGYVFFVRADGGLQIRKMIAGAFTSLTSVIAQTPFVLGTIYNFKITFVGSGSNSIRFERVDGAGASIGTPVLTTDNAFRPAHWRHLISCIGNTAACRYGKVDFTLMA